MTELKRYECDVSGNVFEYDKVVPVRFLKVGKEASFGKSEDTALKELELPMYADHISKELLESWEFDDIEFGTLEVILFNDTIVGWRNAKSHVSSSPQLATDEEIEKLEQLIDQ